MDKIISKNKKEHSCKRALPDPIIERKMKKISKDEDSL